MNDEPTWWQKLLKLDPALVRGFLVAVAGILAQVLGHTVISNDLIQAILDAFSAVSALFAAFLIRPAVTPNAKVVLRDETPLDATSDLQPGEATVPVDSEEDAQEVLQKAQMSGND